MSFNTGIGIAGALAQGSRTLANREEIQAQSAEFKLRKTKADVMNNEEVLKQQLEATQAQNKQIIQKQAKADTYQAMDLYYSSDGDNTHLNTLLQENPTVRAAWRGVTSIQDVNPETDQRLLAQRGIKPEDFNSFRYVKGINPDGQEQIIDMFNMTVGTGYTRYKDNQQLDDMLKRHKFAGKEAKPGPAERDAKYFAGQGAEGGSEADVAVSMYNEKIAGNTPGQLQMADQTVEKLFENFGGEEGYYATDFSDSKNKTKAMSQIHALERYYKTDISPKDRADTHDLSSLISLADLAAEKITPEVTGSFDSVYQTVSNYVSNSVESVDQVEARAAYAQFRNTTRHALFGSALTPTEVASFNEAFGTIRQKYPAVVASFKTALMQTKEKFQSIYDMNNPILMKYYVGKGPDDIAKIIRGLDERLDLLKEQEAESEDFIVPEGDLSYKGQLVPKQDLPGAPIQQLAPGEAPDFSSVLGDK